jgi:hypothetical protein
MVDEVYDVGYSVIRQIMAKKKQKQTTQGRSRESFPVPEQTPAWMDRIQDRLKHTPLDSTRKIFLERAFAAVIDITQAVSGQSLEETASAANNMLVLLKALQSPELLPELERYEPLASPYLKGIQAQQELLRQAGGLMTVVEVAGLLGLTRQAVDKRRVSNKLIAIPQGKHGFGYPACQFNERGPLPGLEELLFKLDTADTWMKLIFLLSPNTTLGDRTPLQFLIEGKSAECVHAAMTFGKHGAL